MNDKTEEMEQKLELRALLSRLRRMWWLLFALYSSGVLMATYGGYLIHPGLAFMIFGGVLFSVVKKILGVLEGKHASVRNLLQVVEAQEENKTNQKVAPVKPPDGMLYL